MSTRDSGGQDRTTRRTDEPDEAPAPRTIRGPDAAAARKAAHRRGRRRDARRDRRGARDQRGGVRPRIRPEGRGVAGARHRTGRPRACPPAFLQRRRRRRSPTSCAGTPLTCCPAAARCPTDVRGAGLRRPARHDDRRHHVPRRRRHGRRPPRHDGQRHRPARHREGLPGRRVLLRRHRRHRRAGRRAGPAVPGRARALREDRGPVALAGRQGQPARHADPRQPRPGDAGPGRRAAVRRVRLRDQRRPDLLLRRHRRPLRGARLPLGRLRLAVRPRLR